jgi:hypothetical protein
LCFAPIAAWSYFSIACIYVVSFFIADVVSVGARWSLYGCVDGSFNCFTMSSTSSSLSSNSFYVFDNV